MLLNEIVLLESLGRGGWFDTKTGKYHDLFFDVNGLTHDEFVTAHPDMFDVDPNAVDALGHAYKNGWVRFVYPETSQRRKNQPPFLGIEGSPDVMRDYKLKRHVNRFIKDYMVDEVIVDLINPTTMRSAGHHVFQMPHQLSKLNATLS